MLNLDIFKISKESRVSRKGITKQYSMFYQLCNYADNLERGMGNVYFVIVPTESGGLILKLCDASDNSWLDDHYVTSYRVGKQVLKWWSKQNNS